jgi:hypothetical protein
MIAVLPGSPRFIKTGSRNPAKNSSTPKYPKNLTTREIGRIIFSSHKVVAPDFFMAGTKIYFLKFILYRKYKLTK